MSFQYSKLRVVVLIFLYIVIFNPKAVASNSELVEFNKPSSLKHVKVNDYVSLDIYVPTNSDPVKRYSTLYVMDGQHYIYNAIGYQKSLVKGISNVSLSPEFIVVGINTEKFTGENSRQNLLFRNPAKLLSVLEQEIIPYIDQNYPSNKTRMYFGWQSGAIFGLHLFNQQPGQIELFLLASGQYYNGEQLGKTEQVLQNNPALKSNIYLNLGQMENHATAHHEALTGILKKHKNPNIKWHFSNSKRFAARSGHHTTPLESLTNGLEWYFSDFADLTFYSLEDIASFGGVKAVKDYYATRANRYQLSTDVSEHTKFSLFRYAAQANNYELFKHFEHQLGTYQVTGWYQFFGRFFLQNDDMDRAEEIYKDAVQKQPGTSIIWAELAEIYEKNHKYKLALKSYEKALELSMQVDESNAKYQQHILQLRSLITSR